MSSYASFTLQATSGSHSDIHAALSAAMDLSSLPLEQHQNTTLWTYKGGTVQVSAYQQVSSHGSLVWTDFVIDTSLSNIDADFLKSEIKALWNTPKRLLIEEWRSGPDSLGFPANARKTLRTIRQNTVWWDYMSAPLHIFAGQALPTADPDAPEDVRDMEAITADQIVTEFLKPVGSNNKNLKLADGSVTPVVCEFGPPATGKKAKDNYISTVVITLEDQNIENNKFGGQTRLPVGCLFQVVDADDNVLKVFNDNVPVRDMIDLAGMAGAVPLFDDQATGLDSYVIEWSMTEHTGGFLLTLRPGDRFQIIVQDDLTDINNFTCVLKGTLAL